MKISPLVMLAAQRIPALTSIFSDALDVTSMAVVEDGLVTLTCATPHGLAVSSQHGICVVDAQTPNPITAWSKLGNGDVRITTEYPHDVTYTPDPAVWEPWDFYATIAGTGVAGLDGNKQLVSVESPTQFTVRPGGNVTLPGSIPGAAKLLKRLERNVIGWHVATATSTTQLTFVTPPGVSRSYTVASPQIVKNIRVWGAYDLDHALSHFTRENEEDMPVPGQGYLFVCPKPNAQLSRDIASRSDAIHEIQPGAVIRQRLMDGFELYAALPAERSGGAVACMDKAHGNILTAVLRTFNGVKMPFSEFAQPNPTVAMMSSHGAARYTRANYVHGFVFDLSLILTDEDSAAAIDVPDLGPFDQALTNGTSLPTWVQPGGTVPFEEVNFGPDPAYGLFQSDQPQPLTFVVTLPPA